MGAMGNRLVEVEPTLGRGRQSFRKYLRRARLRKVAKGIRLCAGIGAVTHSVHSAPPGSLAEQHEVIA